MCVSVYVRVYARWQRLEVPPLSGGKELRALASECEVVRPDSVQQRSQALSVANVCGKQTNTAARIVVR